jgi:Domain of unknown function (DUF4267)
MAATIGMYLSGAIAIAITIIGLRFLIAPYAAAANFGVAITPDPQWDAFLSIKAVRDIASGMFTAILIANHAPHLLGSFILAATIIPVADALIVLRHGGSRSAAYGIHGGTAATMLLTSTLLFAG